MKDLALILGVFFVSIPSYAAVTVEYKEGRVLDSGPCASKYAFSFLDGGRLQHPCVGTTDTVSVESFLRTSRHSRRKKVRVNQRIIKDGVLYASDIEEVFGAPGGRN